MVTPLRGLSCDKIVWILQFFERASNLRFIDILHDYISKFFLIWPNGRGKIGSIFSPGSCSIDFKCIFLTFLLIYIKLAIYWYIIWPYWATALIFHYGAIWVGHMGEFHPPEADQEDIRLGSLNLLNHHTFDHV